MATPTLKARSRTDAETGTRACRALRGQGEVPVNFYKVNKGETSELVNKNLAVSAYELYKLIDQQAEILDLDLDGAIELVRVTEVQRDTFGDDVLHIDLRGIDPNALITATVALEFSGKPQGIKDMSLVSLVTKQMTVSCKPREIPEIVHVDLGTLSAGSTLTASGVTLPAGVSAHGADATIVTVGKAAGA